jgi:GABA permease
MWLLNTIGAIILVVWFFIAVSQLVLRRRTERENPEKLVVKMWLFPGLTLLALAGMATVFALMLREEETRMQLLGTGVLTLVLAVAGFVLQKTRESRAAVEAGATD